MAAGELNLYTVEEVAEILRVNPRLVYREIEQGQLRATRVGRFVRISEAALREYLSKGEGETLATIKSVVRVVKCRLCGKYLKDPDNMVRGLGTSWCSSRVEARLKHGETLQGARAISEERLDEIILELMSEDKPNRSDTVPVDGDRPYITISQMHKYCKEHGVHTRWMVLAIGEDRARFEPLNWKWTPIYVGRNRYIHPDCMTEQGLNELRMAYGHGPRVERVQG